MPLDKHNSSRRYILPDERRIVEAADKNVNNFNNFKVIAEGW